MSEESFQSRVVKLDNARHKGGLRPAPPSIIVWHTSEGDSALSSIEYLNTTTDKAASYGYVIERNGIMYRMTDPAFVAYHAGDSAWPNPKPATKANPDHPNGQSLNAISLGICFANRGDGEELTVDQKASALWLAKFYMTRYDIPVSLNLGHYEVSPGRKTDPEPALNMDDWRRQLTEYLAR